MKSKSFFLSAVLILGVFANGYAAWLVLGRRSEIAEQINTIEQLKERTAEARLHVDKLRHDSRVTQERGAAARASAEAHAASPTSHLRAVIDAMKQLIDENPEQNIPELRLLEPKDWIEIAQKFLSQTKTPLDGSFFAAIKSMLESADPTDPTSATLTELRRKARSKFAAKLQEALRKFLESSQDELPTDILQLAVHLAPPADVEMLRRYTMLRSGKVGAKEEKVIAELSSPTEERDGLLSLSLDQALTPLSPSEEVKQNVSSLAGKMAEAFEKLDLDAIRRSAAGDDETFKQTMRQGVQDFGASHSGRIPEDLLELRPYLKNFDAQKFADGFRQVFALVAYAVVHEMEFPDDAAKLEPYLAQPVDIEATLRAMKIAPDGRGMGFKLGGD